MATAQLSAQPRSETGKGVARSLRRAGSVPAVIYGHGRDPQPLAVDARELERLLDHIVAESTVIELAYDGRTSRTLIREIQRHPLRRAIVHVDFQELVAGEKVIVSIPVVLVGTPEGVRLSGGVMNQVLSELEIRVDPSNIPNHIDVDISKLTIGHSIHVSDLSVPGGVEILEDAEATVAVLAAPKTEAAPVPVEGADAPSEPEVIRKAKTDDDAE